MISYAELQLRGIGACGYYRLCVDGDDEDDEDAKPNKEKHDGSGEGKELVIHCSHRLVIFLAAFACGLR